MTEKKKYKCAKCEDTGVYNVNEGKPGWPEQWMLCNCELAKKIQRLRDKEKK